MTLPTTSSDTPPLPWVGVKAFTHATDKTSLSLVLLRDLVLWLMQSKGMRFSGAVHELDRGLRGHAGLHLYVTRQSGDARAVGRSDSFGIDAPTQGRRLVGNLVSGVLRGEQNRMPMPDGVTAGLSAALYLIGHGWGNGSHDESILERADAYGPSLAMACDQAAEIWGRVAGAVTDDDTQSLGKDEQLLGLLEAYEKRGKNLRAQFATSRGLSESNLKKQLGQARELRKKNATNPFTSLVVVAGNKVAKK